MGVPPACGADKSDQGAEDEDMELGRSMRVLYSTKKTSGLVQLSASTRFVLQRTWPRTVAQVNRPFQAFERFSGEHGVALVRVMLAAAVVAMAFQIRVLTWLPDVIVHREQGHWGAAYGQLEHALPSQLIVALGISTTMYKAPSTYALRWACTLFFFWLAQWSKVIGFCIYREPSYSDKFAGAACGISVLIGAVFEMVSYLLFMRVMMLRLHWLSRLNRALKLPLKSILAATACVTFLVLAILARTQWFGVSGGWWAVMDLSLLFGVVIIAHLLYSPFLKANRFLLAKGRTFAAGGAKRQQLMCYSAARTLSHEWLGVWLLTLVGSLHYAWANGGVAALTGQPAESVLKYYFLMIALGDVFRTLAMLLIAGTLTGSHAAGRRRRAEELRRQQRWAKAGEQWLSSAGRGSTRSTLWQEKVRQLACRGFNLDALLRFYRGLGRDYMLHWDPKRHTTADVVRHAIIPCSAARRCSLAEVMMDDKPTPPQMMVTHNWGNRFQDLVAAIIADALQEVEFDTITHLLQSDMDTLQNWLAASKKLESTYWVCAFSVNQHKTICGGNPQGSVDTVTGELYPLCSCGLPKAWNTTEPVNVHGESIECEVNKFDDMMQMLSMQSASFGQVVAIDRSFTIFSRAWCVAELSAAHEQGMEQRLKVSNMDDFDANEGKLRGLKIEDMEASRPEDKDAILNKITDVAEFNAALQSLLFTELLPAWHRIDGEEQLKLLPNILRWAEVQPARSTVQPEMAKE